MGHCDEGYKVFQKAYDKTKRLNLMADYATVRSASEGISDCMTDLAERIVRYNGKAKDYDMALHELLYEVENLMRRE